MINFLKRNRAECLLVLLLAALFFGVNWGVQRIDETAGVLDLSWFTLIVAGLLKAGVVFLAAFIALGVMFPTVNDWAEDRGFAEDWRQMSGDNKIRVAGAIFIMLLTVLTVCVIWG